MINTKFKLTITPAINLKTRHELEVVLEKEGYTVIGSGQMVDGTFSDITFERIET
uniref:Uncharacterized protein n=1 Tax=viral metagenome TaxID=1070528 RepID=A0A6M3XS58_9ZZZZ